jgi:hypothetical protein
MILPPESILLIVWMTLWAMSSEALLMSNEAGVNVDVFGAGHCLKMGRLDTILGFAAVMNN